MKIKLDFITNSSSTAFIITNKTDKDLNLTDFVLENLDLLDQFLEQYDWHKNDPRFTPARLLESAANHNEKFPAGDQNSYVFGDEQGTVIGMVYDYILRDGGESKSFKWWFSEWLR